MLRLPHLTPALSAPLCVPWGAERGIGRLFRERRAAIAPLVAVAAPVLLMSLGLGVETSRWFLAAQELQRTADVAALAGALAYSQANDAQKGANAAANLAQVNGVSGSSSPTWDQNSLTLTSNKIVAQIVTGVRSSSDQAMKVTVSQDVPLYLAGIFTSAASKTVTASATAELIKSPPGDPVCMLATSNMGVDLSFTGSAQIDASNCTLRSNADVQITGNASVSATGIVAAGTVNVAPQGGYKLEHAGTILDPFASNTALQTAFTNAENVTGAQNIQNISCNGTCSISPGSYSGISISGKNSSLTFSPGLYLVNGDVSFQGGTVSAQGVTIIATGTGTFNGNVSTGTSDTETSGILTASTSSEGGAIPGILFASSSTGTTKFNGTGNLPYSGAIYAPNGTIAFKGNATSGSSGCAEVVASTINFAGNATVAANCSSFGLPTINSLTQTTTVSLVQ